jgi:hypothetical protein
MRLSKYNIMQLVRIGDVKEIYPRWIRKVCLSFKLETNQRHACILDTKTSWASIIFIGGVIVSCFAGFFWIVEIADSSSLSGQSDMHLELSKVKIEFGSPTANVTITETSPVTLFPRHPMVFSSALLKY